MSKGDKKNMMTRRKPKSPQKENLEAVDKHGCEKIIPTRRIDYITPTGLSGATGHTSYYHSMWLTWGFGIGRTETFIELTNEMKKNI